MEGFWQLIAAHVVADFILQGDRMAQNKAWGDPTALSAHFLIHLGAMVALGHTFVSPAAVVAWLSIVLIHVLLDWAKSKVLDPQAPPRIDFFAFLIDQALHLFVIVFIWTRADFRPNQGILAVYRFVLGDEEGRRWGEELFHLLSQSADGWAILSVGLFAVFGGAVLVRKALDLFSDPPPHPDSSPPLHRHSHSAVDADGDPEVAATGDVAAESATDPGAWTYTYLGTPVAPSASDIPSVPTVPSPSRVPAPSRLQKVGRAIGMMERTLVYSLLLQGALSAVGLMLFAKSIARFRELDDRSFAEYYLIGTFLSLLIALAAFGLVQWLTPPDTFPLLRRM